jgi:AbrB family looped-hinge helix DNA binding protein
MRYFGSATVGDRGQMVIPADARRELGIEPGEKMVIFGRGGGRLMLVKAELVSNFVSKALSDLADLERQLREDAESAMAAAVDAAAASDG